MRPIARLFARFNRIFLSFADFFLLWVEWSHICSLMQGLAQVEIFFDIAPKADHEVVPAKRLCNRFSF